MDDKEQAAIDALRATGLEAEARAVEQLRANHKATMDAFHAAQRASYKSGQATADERIKGLMLAIGIASQCIEAAYEDQWASFDALSDDFDDAVTEASGTMTTDEFFAEARRLNLRMLGTPEETRAALDLKDAEIARLRSDAADALRFRWLCENPDWHFIERLCQEFIADSSMKFLTELRRVIDARRAVDLNAFEKHMRPGA
jgi:hypothetical protein